MWESEKGSKEGYHEGKVLLSQLACATWRLAVKPDFCLTGVTPLIAFGSCPANVSRDLTDHITYLASATQLPCAKAAANNGSAVGVTVLSIKLYL